jgi:hypothetical protein
VPASIDHCEEHFPDLLARGMVAMRALLAMVVISAAFAHNEPHVLDGINVKAVKIDIDAAISLTASPNELDHVSTSDVRSLQLLMPCGLAVLQTDWVTVTWSGVSNPNTSTDWIGVYSPSTADPRQTSVIKFKLTNSASGSGSTTFRLINMRADYIFAFFRNGMTSPVLAAWSNNVTFSNCA